MCVLTCRSKLISETRGRASLSCSTIHTLMDDRMMEEPGNEPPTFPLTDALPAQIQPPQPLCKPLQCQLEFEVKAHYLQNAEMRNHQTHHPL